MIDLRSKWIKRRQTNHQFFIEEFSLDTDTHIDIASRISLRTGKAVISIIGFDDGKVIGRITIIQ